MEGSARGAGHRRLPAKLCCHGWARSRTSSGFVPLLQGALHMDCRACPTPWEDSWDLPIAAAHWLLPLLAGEWAGSSEIIERDSGWGLVLAKGPVDHCYSESRKWHRVKGCSRQHTATPEVSLVSSELLSIPRTSLSAHLSDCSGAAGLYSTPILSLPNLEVSPGLANLFPWS